MNKISLIFKLLLLVIIPFMVLELTLRILGIGGSIIYEENPFYGYRQKPSQRFSTYGHPITITSSGFRGPVESSDILCIGCSITYGCAFIKDEDTFAARLGAVNGGVNGWGMQNTAEFLRHTSLDNFKTVIWTIPTGVLFRPFTTLRQGLISTNRRMILRTEYLFRYIWYGLIKSAPDIASKNEFEPNIQAVNQIYKYLNKQKINLYVVILAGKREASGESIRELPYRGILIQQLNSMSIKYFLAVPEKNIPQMYHDECHLTPAGHKWLAEEIKAQFNL